MWAPQRSFFAKKQEPQQLSCNARSNVLTATSGTFSRVVRNQNAEGDSDERYTPSWIFDLAIKVMGGIDLDPCADPRKRVPAVRHLTKEDNGLEEGWSGRVFLNPPFSKSSDWIKHLCVYRQAGAATEAVVLVPVMTLTNKSFRLLMDRTASAFCMLRRHLSFLNASYEEMGEMSAFPFALIYVGDNTQHFLDQVRDEGIGCLLEQRPQNQTTAFCSYCGAAFSAKRSNARFCSSSCRVQSDRKKNQVSAATSSSD